MCLSGYLDPYFDMERGHSRESSGVSAHVVREAHACVVSVSLPPTRVRYLCSGRPVGGCLLLPCAIVSSSTSSTPGAAPSGVLKTAGIFPRRVVSDPQPCPPHPYSYLARDDHEMEALLRFDLPLDLILLEQVVSSLYSAITPEQVTTEHTRSNVTHSLRNVSKPLGCADSGLTTHTVTVAGADLRRGGLECAQLVPSRHNLRVGKPFTKHQVLCAADPRERNQVSMEDVAHRTVHRD
jgi:hypothetical protein